MKTVSVRQIQKLDQVAIVKCGVPSIALMENAGRQVAHFVLKSLRNKRRPKVCIVCGLGNNAGDGFVAARHLINVKIETKIFLIGKGRHLKHDAAINYKILKKLKYPIREIKKFSKSDLIAIKKSDVIIDAVFGVGLNREVLDPFKSIIENLNNHAKNIVSVDTPSGLDGTTGKIYGICIKAKDTVTFTFAKKGFFKNFGKHYAGRIHVVDIGIPEKLKNRVSR